ncbi:hypothetical protein JAAARDRAFT_405492 [Jaapia argillacea MUCL 33604]|uniref:Uncharacterized protein n=1 Tax=Jaapia argillacea MUCL 33604 TaxID=933084 RepID=A0A067PHE1_9AGAM|nr:hypothetical protein JAAARDRAFT_405492 [Jaapia argillacea MUCL 33604]
MLWSMQQYSRLDRSGTPRHAVNPPVSSYSSLYSAMGSEYEYQPVSQNLHNLRHTVQPQLQGDFSQHQHPMYNYLDPSGSHPQSHYTGIDVNHDLYRIWRDFPPLPLPESTPSAVDELWRGFDCGSSAQSSSGPLRYDVVPTRSPPHMTPQQPKKPTGKRTLKEISQVQLQPQNRLRREVSHYKVAQDTMTPLIEGDTIAFWNVKSQTIGISVEDVENSNFHLDRGADTVYDKRHMPITGHWKCPGYQHRPFARFLRFEGRARITRQNLLHHAANMLLNFYATLYASELRSLAQS